VIAFFLTLLCVLGLSLNLAFSNGLVQPDWTVALLLASLLAQRHNWIWVLPVMLLHDAVLYWAPAAGVMMVMLIPPMMIYLDRHLGSGLPQRVVLLMLSVLAMLFDGWTLQACLLTLCLCVPVWHVLTRKYAQQAA